jgi:predicted DNA-binding transcriptional regulator YafY
VDTTITDNYGDELRIDPDEENLYFTVDNDEGFEFDRDAAIQVRDAINEYLGTSSTVEEDAPTANEAKLRLAAQYGLKAKFAYAGERDYRAVERRLEPDTVETRSGVTYVLGESYDQGGEDQGYRQFRLDRISGEVVVR